MSNEWAELAETISTIRAELQQAMSDGVGQQLAFRTGPVELEFSIEVRKQGEAKAKVFVLPFSAEARAGVSADAVHRIKLTLQPIEAATGKDANISGHQDEQPA
ncbi:trypco2 family protein [Streptomyces sp. CBMAI 2042]|uniref:trypco2 family protein n=1 Tax=Streptomyces sp. CBMAI 2042 TaxID=2305222 RepID=UPI001F17C28E|nr:trypco2 family protein [Streptomyces sp. CBMAI 2042]